MNKFEIILYWSNEDQAFIAEVPELPGCAADGTTRQKALADAEVVISEWIQTARKLGRPIPEPQRPAPVRLKCTPPSVRKSYTHQCGKAIPPPLLGLEFAKAQSRRGSSIEPPRPFPFLHTPQSMKIRVANLPVTPCPISFLRSFQTFSREPPPTTIDAEQRS